MPVESVIAENFKGIDKLTDIKIRPLTVFFGANSSGKSTCIHALAALSQTVKIAANRQPLVLDDEFSQIHLGRFVEVVHSRNYKKLLRLGCRFRIDGVPVISADANTKFERRDNVECRMEVAVRCTLRTQDIRIDEVKYTFDFDEIRISRAKGKPVYTIESKNAKISLPAKRKESFFFTADIQAAAEGNDSRGLMLHFMLETIQEAVATELRRVLYLGPFRQPPQRRYPTRGAMPSEVGALGDSAVTLLANEQIQSRTRRHGNKVSKWLQSLDLAMNLEVKRVGQSDLFGTQLRLRDGVVLPLADLGYGLSQVLPVLAQCSFAPDGATLLFEQPELHLHNIATTGLAKVFIETIADKDCRIVVETHAVEFVTQIQKELREGSIDMADVAIYKVRRVAGSTTIRKVEIDSDDYDIYEDWKSDVALV